MADETVDDERPAPDAAHDEHDDKGKKPPAKGKKPDRAKAIIVISSVAAVIIGFMSLRGKGSGSSSSPAAGGSIGAYTPAGNVAGQGSDSSALQGLQTMLDNQAQMLQAQTSALAGLTSAGSTANPPPSTPAPLSTVNFGAPVVTGDLHQDTDLAQSSWLAGLYAAYKKNPTKQTAATYTHGVNQFDAAKTAGQVNQTTLQH